jgi:hypothetical protein
MLKDREKQKQEQAKLRRKQERKMKKKQKEEEKAKKVNEREIKKKLKEMKYKSKKRTVSDESSSDSDTEIYYMDSDDLEESFDDDLAGSCHGCHLSTGDPNEWIGYDDCARWWHIACTDNPNDHGLSHDELQEMPFKCSKC